jgi:putative tryptophan/tyrosine transport system substrate-binding protein
MSLRRRAAVAAAAAAAGLPWITSAMAQAPAAGAQRRIGVLSLSRAGSTLAAYETSGIRAALQAAGYDEGRNLKIEWRYGEADHLKLDALAQELVRLDVELILAITNEPIEAAMRATQRIPIVMIGAALPVELGYVQSLARPGGNVTGTSWAGVEVSGKVFEILHDAVPGATRVTAIAAAAASGRDIYRRANLRTAKALGFALTIVYVAPGDTLASAQARVAASRPHALFVVGEGVVGTQLGQWAAFAQQRKLVSIGVTPHHIQAGGALYYGPNLGALMQRTASYIERIFKGARPADLPVELPAKFDLIVNQKVLKAMGVTLPQALMLRADEVVE